MAKVTGTQNVPSALLDAYRGTLGEQVTGKGIGKRFPYKLPTMQSVGGHPSAKQRAQRERFKTAKADFANVSPSDRARWYAAMPPWGSFLWYYNYFIMSSLDGNADAHAGGFGVVKSIKYYTFTMLSGVPANIEIAIDEVDPAKTVVMLFGAGYWEIIEGASTIVYPYPVSVAAELLIVKASMEIDVNAGGSALVIEYI